MNTMYIDVEIVNHHLAQLVAAAALAEGHEGGLLGEGPRPGQHQLLVILGLDTRDALPARDTPHTFTPTIHSVGATRNYRPPL